MNTEKTVNGSRMDVTLTGKLDTVTAPKFEEEIMASLDNINELYIDMQNVEYISSAGLRALLYLHQVMNEKGKIIIHNVPQIVLDIFELTGFCDIVTVE